MLGFYHWAANLLDTLMYVGDFLQFRPFAQFAPPEGFVYADAALNAIAPIFWNMSIGNFLTGSALLIVCAYKFVKFWINIL